jgi:N-acetyl-gamma-glutamylphosphate reductase
LNTVDQGGETEFPQQGLKIKPVEEDDPCDKRANALFIATPDGVGMEIAPSYVESKIAVVDYSGDFRFQSLELYSRYDRRTTL